MRIIGGSAKGVRLAAVPPGTRPLSDRAREGVFSSLGERVVGATVLDLFAGTGAMGIEALSRGAVSAVFVDASHAAVRAIRENLERAGFAAAGDVRRADATRYARSEAGRFDLVFLDPPYALDASILRSLLAALRARLARDGRLVLTRPRRTDTDVVPLDFEVARTLEYGDTRVHVVREDPRAWKRTLPGDV